MPSSHIHVLHEEKRRRGSVLEQLQCGLPQGSAHVKASQPMRTASSSSLNCKNSATAEAANLASRLAARIGAVFVGSNNLRKEWRPRRDVTDPVHNGKKRRAFFECRL